MRIASVDYGFHTGLAIAVAHPEPPCSIRLEYYFAGTYLDEVPSVLEMIQSSRSTFVVLEKPPFNPTQEAQAYYAKVHDGLIRMGFHEGRLQTDGTLTFQEIGPGIWKPFMKAQHPDFGHWDLSTQHEKDAANMLAYAMYQVDKRIKEVRYE